MIPLREHWAIAEARLGTRLGGDLRLTRLLGVGGMGAVFEAVSAEGRRVAVKVLHPSLSRSLRQRTRFLREAYVASSIDHPGVVDIHGDGVDGGDAYLVMELLEGETVAALARRNGGKVELDDALEIADQLLSVLSAAHARGVIHRDIKPENLFLQTDGRLKVLDFGVARLLEPLPGFTVDTQVGATLGTPAFMAQEQARGRWEEVDQRSDLWAVGATLFTLVTGRYVHEGETPNEQLGRAMTVPARSLGELAPDLPPAFIAAVDRALRFEPAQRWQDARSMQAALRSVRGAAHDAACGVDAVASGAGSLQRGVPTDPASLDFRQPRPGAALRPLRTAGLILGLLAAAFLLWRTAIEGGARANAMVAVEAPDPAAPASRPPARLELPAEPKAPERAPAAGAAPVPSAPPRASVVAAPPARGRAARRTRATESSTAFELLDVRY